MENTAVKKNKKGFTLVELVIVVAVLAVLAAIAVPTVTNIISTANKNADDSNAQTIELALKSAYAEAAAGTWDISKLPNNNNTLSTFTVASALNHEGLNLKGISDSVKQKSSSGVYVFVYDPNTGHITCVPSKTDATPLVSEGLAVQTVIHAQ